MIFMHITGTKYHFRARGKDKTFSYKLRVEKYFHLQSMQYLSLKLIIYHSNVGFTKQNIDINHTYLSCYAKTKTKLSNKK